MFVFRFDCPNPKQPYGYYPPIIYQTARSFSHARRLICARDYAPSKLVCTGCKPAFNMVGIWAIEHQAQLLASGQYDESQNFRKDSCASMWQ